jgi:hypothetical protein
MHERAWLLGARALLGNLTHYNTPRYYCSSTTCTARDPVHGWYTCTHVHTHSTHARTNAQTHTRVRSQVDEFVSGQFTLDKIMDAFHAMHSGTAIRSVVVMSD